MTRRRLFLTVLLPPIGLLMLTGAAVAAAVGYVLFSDDDTVA